jgi:hypothetical protein
MPATVSTALESRSKPYGCWPAANHVELLRAALLEGDKARLAWKRWKTTIDSGPLDNGSQRLLPLLVHNLKRQGITDAHFARFEDYCRYVWVRNQLRMAEVAPLLHELHLAHIPTMLLKGAALVLKYYPNQGLRPMSDVDLLVPTSEARRAIELLRAHGWRPAVPDPELRLAVSHSTPFFREEVRHMDLHWHALWEGCGPAADDEYWANAEAASIGSAQTSVPAAPDLLLHVIVHGGRWNAVPPIRWVADAMMILRTTGRSFDWGRLVALSGTHALVLPVREALSFLTDAVDAAVPPTVIADLAVRRVSAFERIEHRMRNGPSRLVGGLPFLLCRHVRVTRSEGAAAVVWRLPQCLQRAYGVPTLRALPADLCVRAARKLREAMSAPGH